MTGRYVQYGCGWSAPEGWLNFDASLTLRFERLPFIGGLYTKNARRFPPNARYGDIVRGLPIEEESCKGIYCSHVLEHLALADVDRALQHTYQYLERNGTFRLVIPDLEQLARAYLEDTDPMASGRFLEASGLGAKERARGMRAIMLNVLGNSAHLWMWDERSLAHKLGQHGFRKIRRAVFGDAEDPRFNEVEEEGRFAGSLGMQCVR